MRFALLLGCAFILLVLLVLLVLSMLLVRAKSFRKKIKSLNGPKKLIFVSSRQFSILNGSSKLVFVRMYKSTFTGLLGPPYSYYSLVVFFICILTHFLKLKCKVSWCPHKPVHAGTYIRTWRGLWGHWLFNTFLLWNFSFFYFLFSFLLAYKKHKNENKRISYFLPLDVF